MPTITKPIEQKLASIKDLLDKGWQAWVDAGDVLIDLLDNEGLTLNDICAATNIDVPYLVCIERLGRKLMIPELLLANYPAGRFIKELPISEQRRIYNDGVKVVVDRGKDILLVSVQDLTANQTDQVFVKGHLRGVPGQRAYLEDRETKAAATPPPAPPALDLPYVITKTHVTFKKDVKLTKRQVEAIIKQMK